MQATTLTLPPGRAAPADLRQQLRASERRRRLRSIALTLPLLAFLLAVFVVPLAALMIRAVENPEVAGTLSATGSVLADWDGRSAPPEAAYGALVRDLSGLQETAQAGALARRLNSEVSGARSLIMGTYRALPLEPGLSDAQVREQLLQLDARWAELPYWQAIAKNSARWTPDYLLASVDLRRNSQGEIVAVPAEAAAFRDILVRTFEMSATVTLIAILLGYPLAYWLSLLPERRANLMMILVLVPFWTSVLVRIAAWIVLLQNNGLLNRALMGLGLTEAPVALLFNRLGVVIAMVHILLPFLILPLYSVMKTVPPNYLRAAISLGSTPLAAFFKVYVPQTYPGVAAGGLLVFITSIGYYVTPALLGGPSDQMLSYYVAQYTNVEVNWGMAAALGSVLLVTTLALYAVYRKFGKAELGMG
ncbi:ABC transporter permease [Melaminivora sp.]|uniref:ABC transporter permease n=1 Tax=Melaminivora sp. TaxID=1933032 RepID=UPI0028AEE3D8|nr:ABC transporter permease [Melaminivora sp.]